MTCPCGAEFCYLCGRGYTKKFAILQAIHTGSKMVPFVTCPKLWKSTPKRIATHTAVTFGIITFVYSFNYFFKFNFSKF